MTLFDGDTVADYLEALGESATVGAHSLLIDLVDAVDEIEVGGELLAGRPYALADPVAVTAAGVVVGSVLVVGARSWKVTALEADEANLITLWLEVVPAAAPPAGVVVGSILLYSGKSWEVTAIEIDSPTLTTLKLEAV